MLQNAYFLAKIGADTAENEQHFAEILPIGRRVADRPTEGQMRQGACPWRLGFPGAATSGTRPGDVRPAAPLDVQLTWAVSFKILRLEGKGCLFPGYLITSNYRITLHKPGKKDFVEIQIPFNTIV